MANVASDFVQSATNFNAQNVVFSDKPDQLAGNKDDSSKEEFTDSSASNINQKEFYWDQIMFYLVSAILGLSFLDISVEFFRGSVVQCFTPPDLTRDQISYLNNYCYGSLPDSQYYLIFILISALLMIAPHYLWNSYFGRHFDFFFDLVKKLDRLRDSKTGDYNPLNFEIVNKLENKFCKFNTWIYRLYMLKLLGQLLITIVVLLANALYFQENDFKETFICPEIFSSVNNTNEWPLDKSVVCVYNSLNLLKFLRWAAFILLGLAIIFEIVGLVWGVIRHPDELGIKEIALFCEASALPPEEHNFPSFRTILFDIFSCGRRRKLQARSEKPNGGSGCDSNQNSDNNNKIKNCHQALMQIFHPRISSDLDFLILKLFFADSGHGQVFKDIQIYKEIQQRTAKDQELLHLLKRVYSDFVQGKIQEHFEQEGAKSKQETREWKRHADITRYFFEAGLKEAGPGRNPDETEIYKRFQFKMGISIGDWNQSILRSVMYGFFKFGQDINKLALDFSFGSSPGYSLVLARAFQYAVTIHFNKFYKNPKAFQVKKYQAGYRIITYRENLFSQDVKNITQCEEELYKVFTEKVQGRKIDVLVIGPITDRSKIVTANLQIEKLFDRECFRKGSILIAVRPLKIGSKNKVDHFVQFKPPESLFDSIGNEVEEKLSENGIYVYSVSPCGKITLVPYMKRETSIHLQQKKINDFAEITKPDDDYDSQDDDPPKGIVVQCEDLECIFEFKLYRFKEQSKNAQMKLPPEQPPHFNNSVQQVNGHSILLVDETSQETSQKPPQLLVPLN